MLLNQQLHKAGGTEFIFPGGRIPEWLDKQSNGPSISFWFRNKFPAKVVCILIAPVMCSVMFFIRPMVFMNGKVRKCLFHPMKTKVEMLESDYTHLFDLRRFLSHGAMMEVGLENEWKHVEVTYEGVFETSVIKAMGVHVVKEENINMEDIRYDDPYTIMKLENQE